jgi:hypothetical protein
MVRLQILYDNNNHSNSNRSPVATVIEDQATLAIMQREESFAKRPEKRPKMTASSNSSTTSNSSTRTRTTSTGSIKSLLDESTETIDISQTSDANDDPTSSSEDRHAMDVPDQETSDQNSHYLKNELYGRIQTEPELFEWMQRAALDGIWVSTSS